jgi:hypothetical protein
MFNLSVKQTNTQCVTSALYAKQELVCLHITNLLSMEYVS